MSDTQFEVSGRRFEVTVPGGILAGIRAGRSEPLLVLHGGPGLSDYSAMFADELTGWETLRYNQRGVDPSTTAGPFTVSQHVSDALAVLDQHGIDTAVVLGHSWGGYLAMHVAAPRHTASGLVSWTLVAEGDGGFAETLTARTSPLGLARVAELDELMSARADRGLLDTGQADAAALESLQLTWPSYFAEPSAAPAWPDGLQFGEACYSATFESISAAQSDGQLPDELAQFSGPVDVVAGSASPFPADVAESTAALFRDSQVSFVEGAGHFPWFERPGCVAAALRPIATRLAAS